jgi:hypothetical protein
MSQIIKDDQIDGHVVFSAHRIRTTLSHRWRFLKWTDPSNEPLHRNTREEHLTRSYALWGRLGYRGQTRFRSSAQRKCSCVHCSSR